MYLFNEMLDTVIDFLVASSIVFLGKMCNICVSIRKQRIVINRIVVVVKSGTRVI